MPHKNGKDRNQVVLLPEAIEDYVSEDNIVRFVDEYVNCLDLEKLGFRYAKAEYTGRPPYFPGDMLKLYIYGYLMKIRSSRCLERETHRNLEVKWLIRDLTPDHKTIANFRSENRKALKKVFSEFILFCRELDLMGNEVVAIDGSKFRAVNSKSRNYNAKRLKKLLESIDRRLNEYLEMLDKSDSEEVDDRRLTVKELQEKIQEMKKRKAELEGYQNKINSGEVTQVSLTDPDSRCMKDGSGTNVCYNVQSAVDKKNKLIVAYKVTSAETDLNLLSEMAVLAKEALDVDKLTVVADRGYHKGDEIRKCLDAGIIPYVPSQVYKIAQKNGVPAPEYLRECFHYHRERNLYICPEGHELNYQSTKSHGDRTFQIYRCNHCANCPSAGKCTTAKEGRTIFRRLHEDILEEMKDRLKEDPEMMKLRKSLVEHPFGVVKRCFGHGYVLLKGLAKVSGEMGLCFLTFNIRRAVNILGVKKLIEEVRRRLSAKTSRASNNSNGIDALNNYVKKLHKFFTNFRLPSAHINHITSKAA